jgi:predicted nucleic acid-binding protein
MMRLVLDASVAMKWVLTEADSAKALAVRADYQNQTHELLTPDIFPVEIAHGLAKAERRGIVPQGDADKLLTNVLSTPPQLHSHLPLLKRALEIASQARHGVYDCLYIALAEREGCDLLTADESLVRKLPGSPILLLSSL